ncbi:MAG: crotonase [Alkaliphilus sp.]|jgi:enoyl-CoA hydratase|nr:enoyl-CoA hydratase/isomerase family protein [bacterium AH-315-G05]PHS35808.1 MAG: crotonase [Alkaliphilus sp.]
MSQYKNLIFEKQESIATITIDRPKALNALNRDTLTELSLLLEEIKKDKEIRVVIITGNGKAFVAGADITEMMGMTAIEGHEWSLFGQGVFNKIEELPQPVIAAVNGFALGGGCELAMACDIRIASEKAKFGQPEVSLGIIPGFAGTQRLPRLVGLGVAKELLYSGKMIDANEAYRIGLANKVVPVEDLLNEVNVLAKQIAKPATYAVQMCKKAVNTGMSTDLSTASKYESALFGQTFSSDDKKEGMEAFLQKRKAEFTGK